ncbi:MAG TPA: hypothetical protein VK797_02825 [Tepidisphaeraceae bacterium]|jgi:hypothetical protein|nr:hypothetical protein [Tepidisphaeraceae bacterium]
MSIGKKPIWPWWNGLWTGVFIGCIGGAFVAHGRWLDDPFAGLFMLLGTSVGLFVAWLPDMVVEIYQQVQRYRDAAKP